MTGSKKTITMVYGAAALAFAVGFGGIGVTALGSATAPPTTNPAASIAPAPENGPGTGVHDATLTGLIAFGNDSGVHPQSHPQAHSQAHSQAQSLSHSR